MKIYVHKVAFIGLFPAALNIIVQNGEPQKYRSTIARISRLWFIHAMQSYPATKCTKFWKHTTTTQMDLKTCWVQEARHRLIPAVRLYPHEFSEQEKIIHGDRNQKSDFLVRGCAGNNWAGLGGNLWPEGNVSHLDGGVDHVGTRIHQSFWDCILNICALHGLKHTPQGN